MSTPELLMLRIEKLVHGGDALGRLADTPGDERGQAVFVAGALPGEMIRARVVQRKPGYLRAEMVEILEPAPERISPRCRHFGACGGCQYQHIPYEVQLRYKSEILKDQLQRIGRFSDPPLKPIEGSPAEWNYRNHVQFHVNAQGEPGYMDLSGRQVLAISECHLPEAGLNSLWPKLQFKPGSSIERVALRAGRRGENMLVLQAKGNPSLPLETGDWDSLVSVSGGHTRVLAGGEYIHIEVKQRSFRVSAGSFFQVNTSVAEKMVEHLLDILPVDGGCELLDLYCGVGLFSAFLAGKVQRVIGVESSPSACEDFVHNLQEFNNAEIHEGRAEDVLPGLDARPDAVILDPPRAGMAQPVLDALIRLSPRHVAYVSCDPATFSRDAARLVAGGYTLEQVTPFDLFPQTFHIESISLFEKSGAA